MNKRLAHVFHLFKDRIFYSLSDLVDCSDCGLAWIIRDNRQLLKSVQGTCNRNASATPFQELDEHDYDQCEASSGDEEDAQSSWLYYLLMKLVGVGF